MVAKRCFLFASLVLAACGAIDAGYSAAGGTGGEGECREAEYAPCVNSGDCGAGMACFDTGVRCVNDPCPTWVCLRPCAADADCDCSGRTCREELITSEGKRVRVCSGQPGERR